MFQLSFFAGCGKSDYEEAHEHEANAHLVIKKILLTYHVHFYREKYPFTRS
jgi:hypothetical protein